MKNSNVEPFSLAIAVSAQEAENRNLRVRIAELENEVDLLKKASAYFAKHQR